MDIELKNQLLYIITDERLGYSEYNLPNSNYIDSHVQVYSDFLCDNPELGMVYNLSLDRGLPEQLREEGAVVYNGFGSIDEKYRELLYGFEYSGGVHLPKNFTIEQKKILSTKLKELKEIYLEFTYYEGDKVQNVCDNKRDTPKYKVYQKLERIITFNG